MNHLNHVIELFFRHSRVNTNPECVVHNEVTVLQISNNSISICPSDLIKCWMVDNVTGEEKTSLNVVLLNVSRHLISAQTTLRSDTDKEAEP